jgi:hypothetical protein
MTTRFLENRIAVEAEVDVPNGFSGHRRLVPFLGYPAEVFGVTNQPLRQTTHADSHPSMPRVELLRPGGMLVWVTAGDYAFDENAPALTGPKGKLSDDEIRARPAVEVSFVPPLSERDTGFREPMRWPNAHIWARGIVLSPRHYINLYAFAYGTDEFTANNRPPREMAEIVGSLKFRDYS